MKRRTFFKTSALATPVVLMGCKPSLNESTDQSMTAVDKVKMVMLSMQRASWEQGLAAQAFMELGDIEMTIRMAKEAMLRQQGDGRLSVLYTDNGVTDPAASGEAVLFAAMHLDDPKLKDSAQKMLEYLLTTPHKTGEGILHHTINAAEIWIDAMYMAPPFLSIAGEYKEAIKQIDGFRDVLWNREKRLYSHRWDVENKTFINEKFWGVGNGWALAGICRVVNALPDNFKSERERLTGYIKEHLDSCLQYIRPDGLFHNNMDEADSFVETNLSQMIAYTIYTGINTGWLDASYNSEAEKMRTAAHNMLDEFGYVQGVCGAPYFDSPGVATEGQAFFLLMEAAYKKS